MSQENRLFANRKAILDYIQKAREELARVDRRLAKVEDALAALKEARVKVKAAKSLASAKPTPRSRWQPSPILKALDRADNALAREELKIRQVPVTKLEKLQKVARRHQKARASEKESKGPPSRLAT
jgi:hypothetical protein